MLISPISSVKINTNFKAEIRPSASLKEGFDMMEKCADSMSMKDMNSVKEFIDSLVKISETSRISEFKIDVDKRRPEYTYLRINGKRVNGGHNERQTNLLDSYIVVQGTKNYASKLEESSPTVLDYLKSQIEETEEKLYQLKERYGERLKAELQQAKKVIFDDVK